MDDITLITGGAGFIGSNLARRLLEHGHQVRVLDNLSKGNKAYLNGLDIEFYEADITKPDTCDSAFKGVTKVVHLAAMGSVVESVSEPQNNFDVNVVGTFNVLNLAVKAGVKKLVFSSTGGAIMGNTTPPVNEKSLPKPISPYGASKLCCEAYCHAYAESYDIATICLRFANVYGPNSEHKTGVVNKFAEKVMRGESLTIFGDGSSTRDYIHVSDLCQGIELALNDTAIKNDVLHIATGKETSLQELAELFLEFGSDGGSSVEYFPTRVGEVERNFALYDYAQKMLGYQPKISLHEGMKEAYQYLAESYSH